MQDPPGIHNLFSLGKNVYSGSSPKGDEGFAALAKLGIKTLISVDGGRPDVDKAKAHGMRYAHLPHGYDGIPEELRLRLAKAAEVLPGPIFVHCHHGLHRGPAAAAVICLAAEGWTAARAEAWLRAAGTSTNYPGLYQASRTFQKPDAASLSRAPWEFPEIATVAGLVEAMVAIDERWENLTAVRAAGYRAPKDHPDLKPANEAVILWEHYREAQRMPEAVGLGPDFLERLKTSEREAKFLERLLDLHWTGEERGEGRSIEEELERAFAAVGRSCISCHKAYRDGGASKPRSHSQGLTAR